MQKEKALINLGSAVGNQFGIDFSQLTCNPGYEIDELLGVLCFPKCEPGFVPFLFGYFCASTCNQVRTQIAGTNPPRYEFQNTGDDWSDIGLICLKRLYDRGIGTIPDACADNPNEPRQLFIGMCYKLCGAGKIATTWAPTTCSQPCPPNTQEAGFANCTKVNEYGRGAGNWGLGCSTGFTNMGLFCLRIAFQSEFPFFNISFQNYQCPQGNYDPLTNPGGRCLFAPSNGGGATGAMGVNDACTGTSVDLGSVNDVNGRIKNAFLPFGNIAFGDRKGNQSSIFGCYPNPNNPGTWLTDRGDTPATKDPTYYIGAYYPKWHPASNCTRTNTPVVINGVEQLVAQWGGANCFDLPNDYTANIPNVTLHFPPRNLRGGVFSNVPVPAPTTTVPYYSLRAPKVSDNCEENWGSLCYPQCDTGFRGFGCCICSPSCGDLADHGATCSRANNDRGVGIFPNACRDQNKAVDTGLCYTRCKQDFAPFVTTCTRRGCPHGSLFEAPLTCQKNMKDRGAPSLAVPAIGSLVNSKLNIGKLTNSLQKIVFNSVIIVGCILLALFVLLSNGYLRTSKIKVKKFP